MNRQVTQTIINVREKQTFKWPHNSLLIINAGTSNVLFQNALPIAPGASYGYGLNANEVNITPFTITFDDVTGNNAILIVNQYAQ